MNHKWENVFYSEFKISFGTDDESLLQKSEIYFSQIALI